MRHIALSIAAISACSLVVVSCGGGGDDGPNVVISDIAVPVVDEDTAPALTGGTPLDLSRHVIEREHHAIIDAADFDNDFVWGKSIDEDGAIGFHGFHQFGCLPSTCPLFRDYYSPTIRFRSIMTQNGIPLARSWDLQGQGDGGKIETFGYGGWMDHSMFAVQLWLQERHYEGERWLGGGGVDSLVTGLSSGTNPVTGPLEWNGVMVGRNSNIESSFVANVIQGDALISADLSGTGGMSIDVMFSNIVDLNAGRSLASMTWTDLSVTSGTFESDSIAGSFFGPQHEEVAGVFERNRVIGAFGASRSDQ